jgi:tripartite-type tricarboxylate transporter receptor subunit TctC
MLSGFSSTLSHIKSGRLRPLAVTSAKRSSVLPNVPTISEAGFPGVEATAWHGLFAPAGTPKAIIDKLHDATVLALAAPDVKERLTRLEFDIVGSSPEAFSTYIQSELKKWAPTVKASGAKSG